MNIPKLKFTLQAKTAKLSFVKFSWILEKEGRDKVEEEEGGEEGGKQLGVNGLTANPAKYAKASLDPGFGDSIYCRDKEVKRYRYELFSFKFEKIKSVA